MCMICDRIEKTIAGKNRYFVRELETGYVVLGDYQRFKGYTLFLCKTHATEIHFLQEPFRSTFLKEMALAAEAAYKAFQPDKMNYELLGAGEGVHMHWHFFPRRQGDTPRVGPVWQLPMEEMYHERYLPTDEELIEMKKKLNAELDILLGV
jgi:Diadenosine tetraphosphate (Ap4A) hydrolase and other HIT family hydrolases